VKNDDLDACVDLENGLIPLFSVMVFFKFIRALTESMNHPNARNLEQIDNFQPRHLTFYSASQVGICTVRRCDSVMPGLNSTPTAAYYQGPVRPTVLGLRRRI
jgi:hypothetical protein